MEPKPSSQVSVSQERTPEQRARLLAIPGALAFFTAGLAACANSFSDTSRRLDNSAPVTEIPAQTPVFVSKNPLRPVDVRLYEQATAQPQVRPEFFFSESEAFSREDFELARKSIVRLQITFPNSTDRFGFSGVVTSISPDKLEILTVRHAFEEGELGDAGVPNLRIPDKLSVSRPDVESKEIVFSDIGSVRHGTFEDGFDFAIISLELRGSQIPFPLEEAQYLNNYRVTYGEHVLSLGYPYVYYWHNSTRAALSASEGVLTQQGDVAMTLTDNDKQNVITYTQVMCGDAAVGEGASGGGIFVKRNGRLYCVGVNTIQFNGMSCASFIPETDRLVPLTR